MKILYGVQATGNGHLARAGALLPLLRQYADVDLLISGHESRMPFPEKPMYGHHGLSFCFGNKGDVDPWLSILRARPLKLLQDIAKCPVGQYDVVISDFEPISSWAAKIKCIPCIALSHQAAFVSPDVPRPPKHNRLCEGILKSYAPADHHIGIHFRPYSPNIFSPVIRNEVRSLRSTYGGHISVYLSAYDPTYLGDIFRHIPEIHWKVFSHHVSCQYRTDNLEVFPVSGDRWLKALASCQGTIMGAGFEGPSEALYLEKKLLVIPIKNQYEQQCNAAALASHKVACADNLTKDSIPTLRKWLHTRHNPSPFITTSSAHLAEHAIKVAESLIVQRSKNYAVGV